MPRAIKKRKADSLIKNGISFDNQLQLWYCPTCAPPPLSSDTRCCWPDTVIGRNNAYRHVTAKIWSSGQHRCKGKRLKPEESSGDELIEGQNTPPPFNLTPTDPPSAQCTHTEVLNNHSPQAYHRQSYATAVTQCGLPCEGEVPTLPTAQSTAVYANESPAFPTPPAMYLEGEASWQHAEQVLHAASYLLDAAITDEHASLGRQQLCQPGNDVTQCEVLDMGQGSNNQQPHVAEEGPSTVPCQHYSSEMPLHLLPPTQSSEHVHFGEPTQVNCDIYSAVQVAVPLANQCEDEYHPSPAAWTNPFQDYNAIIDDDVRARGELQCSTQTVFDHSSWVPYYGSYDSQAESEQNSIDERGGDFDANDLNDIAHVAFPNDLQDIEPDPVQATEQQIHGAGSEQPPSNNQNDSQDEPDAGSDTHSEGSVHEDGDQGTTLLAAQQEICAAQLSADENHVGSYLWYKKKLHESPVQCLPGQHSLAQILYTVVRWKLKNRVTDNGFLEMMHVIVGILLRPQYYDPLLGRVDHAHVALPTTKYMLYKLLGMRRAAQYEWHLCPEGCHIWPPLRAGQWKKRKFDRCPVCDFPRFKLCTKTKDGIHSRVPSHKPSARFWSLGIRQAIQRHFFTNAEFTIHRGTQRQSNQFYRSAEYHRLCNETLNEDPDVMRETLQHPNHSIWELGYDGFAPYEASRKYTCGMFYLRCRDIPDRWLNLSSYVTPVGIVAGPCEPTNLEGPLRPLLEQFRKYGPGGEKTGVLVRNAHQPQAGTFFHKIVLGGIHVDGMARIKLLHSLAVNATVGCPYCCMETTHCPDFKFRYYMGYSEPVLCEKQAVNPRLHPPQQGPRNQQALARYKAFMNDSRLKLDSQQLLQRMKDGGRAFASNIQRESRRHGAPHVQRQNRQSRQRQSNRSAQDQADNSNMNSARHEMYGYKGCADVFSILPYTDPHTLCPLPVAHTLLYGVLSNIWHWLLNDKSNHPSQNEDQYKWVHGLPTATINLIQARSTEIVTTCRQSCGYLDIVEFYKHYKMHHWLDWADWGSQLILHDVRLMDDEDVDRIIRRVHAAVVWFCYPCDSSADGYWKEFDAAYNAIYEWAAYVERNNLSRRHLTYNLHVFLCHIREQVKKRGHCGMDKELWIERMVKESKFHVRGRGSRWPEIVICHANLLKFAMSHFRARFSCRELDDVLPYLQRVDYGRREQDGNRVGDDEEDMTYGQHFNWTGDTIQHRGALLGIACTGLSRRALLKKGCDADEVEKLVRYFFSSGILQQAQQRIQATRQQGSNREGGPSHPDEYEYDTDDGDYRRSEVRRVPRLLQSLWKAWDPRWGEMLVFDRMYHDLFAQIHSCSYTVPRTTESYWVLAWVRTPATDTGHLVSIRKVVAKILYFVKVGFPLPSGVQPDSPPTAPVRLAVIIPFETKRVKEFRRTQSQLHSDEPRDLVQRKYYKVHKHHTVETWAARKLRAASLAQCTRAQLGTHNLESQDTSLYSNICAIAVDDILEQVVRCPLVNSARELSRAEAIANREREPRKNSRKKNYSRSYDTYYQLFAPFKNLSVGNSYY